VQLAAVDQWGCAWVEAMLSRLRVAAMLPAAAAKAGVLPLAAAPMTLLLAPARMMRRSADTVRGIASDGCDWRWRACLNCVRRCVCARWRVRAQHFLWLLLSVRWLTARAAELVD